MTYYDTFLNKKLFIPILISMASLILILAPKTLQAQELPRYQVEVIVFEVGAIRGWTEEHWPAIEEPLSLEGSVRAKSLPSSQFLLSNVAEKLSPQKGYRILTHQSWRVYGHSERRATPIKIENFPASAHQTKLLGTMTFHKSRFAHVRLNLQIERAIPNRVKEDFANYNKKDILDLPQHWRFEINESRRIRPSELHYIDHPLFGAIIRIKPLN